MFAFALQGNTYFTQEDYFLDKNPETIEERFLKYYANLLDDLYDDLKASSYSPLEISPKEAAGLYTRVVWFEKGFTKMEKLYFTIKNESSILTHIYDTLVGINEECGEAKECLSKLKDPKIHESILKSVSHLQNSNFLND